MRIHTSGRRVSVDLSDRVPILEEEVLEGDVVVVIIFSVVEPVVAKYYQLCRYEHDLGNNQDTITFNYKTPPRLPGYQKIASP